MVTEAVAELAGTVIDDLPEIRVELPVDAHLPEDYVSRNDLRLEAYRKLAAAGVTADADGVEALRSEWEDRYGPLPAPAEVLLSVAGLRTVCVARGITEVVVTKGPGLGGPEFMARCSPVVLPLSRQTRLGRLHRDARYKEGPRQLLLPLRKGDMAATLTGMLEDLVPTSNGVSTPAGGDAEA
jgi:transcription-repair coupling factor (superfamily II helicase)